MNTDTWNPGASLFMKIVHGEEKLEKARVTVGFDGFIDVLVRPIFRTAKEASGLQYFQTIDEFGSFLSSHKGVSCSIETEVFSRKFGGNAPLLSNALSSLGVSVDCIGTFGKENIDPVFQNLTCNLYSFDEAGMSTALEFTDGKVLLGERICKKADWKAISDCTASVGFGKLIERSDLLALVNWSEISYSYDLWKGVLENYIMKEAGTEEKRIFFDLCDISRKSHEEILQVLELIKEFSSFRKSILSLNRNEANLVGIVIGTKNYTETGEKLRHKYNINEVIIHGYDESLLVQEGGSFIYRNHYVHRPVVLTGAGDNFNGACCAAFLLGLEGVDCLWFAAKFAEEYVKTGVLPTLEDMKTYARAAERQQRNIG